jgi:peptidyl-prolyl cis-trans isomerase-like 3
MHTNMGDVKFEIFCDTCPRTAFNFLALAGSGYYDGSSFHRNMKGFMLQGGDPTSTGKGGKSIWGGKFADEFHPSCKHNKRGMLSMANSGADTNKSQFFLTYGKQAHLNNVYTVFGKTIDGIDVLDATEKIPVNKKHKPLTDITIKGFTIHANPLAQHMVVYPSATGPPEVQG